MSTAYLILENGAVFEGRQFGHDGEAVGELVFTTGMTGYLETLSDPSYFGQIVLQTFPLIGNYGVIPQEFGQGPVHLCAYIVREWCQEPSNFRSEGNLDSFLREQKTPGLFGIDTRELTRTLRENGTMNAMLSKTPELSDSQWAALRGYKVTGAAEGIRSFTGDRQRLVRADPFRDRDPELGFDRCVVLWDFGCAPKLAETLHQYRCICVVVGNAATAEDILTLNPDGVILSGGPGDPAENVQIIGEIKKLCDKGVPLFGVGLGHQMLALALGASTEKLRFGHRGANQPVRDLKTGRVFVTTQNHGYAVSAESLPEGAAVRYEGLNDGVCEGIDYVGIPAFSVQFEPAGDIVERFITIVKGGA